MAIQFRRGQYNKFDKTKMLAGEPAVVLGGDPDTADGKALYIAFAQGDATRMARADEMPGEASQSAAGLMSAGDKAKLDGVAAGANAYVHPSYTARTGKPTGNQTPAFGGTFPVSQIVTDAQGHVTAATDRTVRIPDTEASQGAHGLMSAADKKALDAIKVTAGNKLHRLVTAPVVTASDAYAAPPVALVVDGKSVQDGTPTPDAPVPIVSVGPDSDGGVKLAAAGVNLYRETVRAVGETWTNTVNVTKTGYNSYVLSGTASGTNWVYGEGGSLAAGYYVMLPAGTYVASLGGSAASKFTVAVRGDVNGSATVICTGPSPQLFTLAEDTLVKVAPVCVNGQSYSNEEVTVQLELGSTATPYQPYVGITIPIDLGGHALRSLPDGTHDELRVDSDGNVTLVQRVGVVNMGTLSWTQHNVSADCFYCTPNASPSLLPDGLFAAGGSTYSVSALMCTGLTVVNVNSINGITGHDNVVCMSPNNPYIYVCDEDSATAAALTAAMSGIMLHYLLATPVEIPLGTVALPSMPAPDLTAWASCTPATEIGLDYERDVNIAVERLEAAIAELATN